MKPMFFCVILALLLAFCAVAFGAGAMETAEAANEEGSTQTEIEELPAEEEPAAPFEDIEDENTGGIYLIEEEESVYEGVLESGAPETTEPTPPDIAVKSAPIELGDNSIVVYSFEQFKSALSENNQYVNIYLGADIGIKALGVEIHTSKTSVVISGISPLDGSGPYTIDEYNSLDLFYTIRVMNNNGTKEVTVKDVNITGRNYYGTVYVAAGVTGVTVTFDNVNYNGPQISYNIDGTTRITGNSVIDIIGGNGLSTAEELAEVNGLELGGNTVINHYAPVTSGLWMRGSNSYIRVLEGADVTWNETGSYMIYQSVFSSPTSLTLEEGARLTINSLNGLFFDKSVNYHQFGDVLLKTDSTLKITQGPDVSGIPIMKVKNNIQIMEGASLILIANGAPQLLYMTGQADLTATLPDTLALYNKNGRLIEWDGGGVVSLLTSFANYWSTPCDIAELGGFNDSPLYRYRKKDGENLLIEIMASAAATTSVSSDYSDGGYGDAPTEATLSLREAAVLTAGRLPLSIYTVTDTSARISGEAEPNAALRAEYTGVSGNSHTVYGQAGADGSFEIDLQSGDMPVAGSMVEVYGSIGYKSAVEKTVVIQTPSGGLMIDHVPRHMAFPDVQIDAGKKLVQRKDKDWRIVIGDYRSKGSSWELYTRLASPLCAIADGAAHTIENAVIYIDEYGNKTPLNNGILRIAEGVKEYEVETVLDWHEDMGVMLDIDTSKVLSDVNYSASLEWILIDGP